VIAIVAVVVAVDYGAWYFGNFLKNDAAAEMVIAALKSDRTARSVLGDDIQFVSVTSASTVETLATGKTTSFIARVKGSTAEGAVSATVVSHDHVNKITVLILTGPDGRTYDLLHAPQAPPENSI
jgi:hypothetical protein